jgi:hypothetical protein
LNKTNLDLLVSERTYAVNAIWKMFDKTRWRPTDWVHGERHGERDKVVESLKEMARTDARLWIPTGYFALAGRRDVIYGRPVIPYVWCDRLTREPWHLDLGDYICKYGTSVNVAVQLAVVNGADEIYLLGCDLGETHFYNETFKDPDLALDAHKIAKECSPVPIYNATVGGNLEVFPRVKLEDIL